jgi:hypothetical protein
MKYEKQQRAFEELIAFIHETIISQNFIYIQKTKSHSWHQLRVLKTRLASTNETRSLKIENRYHKLCEGSRDMNTEVWLKNWQVTYIDVKAYAIAEITGHRPMRDFLMVIADSNAKAYLITFADNHLMNLTENTDMYDLIEKFRGFARLRQRSRDSQSSSGHDFSSEKPFKECLCGAIHRWNECFYLFPELRLSDWAVDPIIQASIDRALSNDRIRIAVESVIQKRREYFSRLNQSSRANQVMAANLETFWIIDTWKFFIWIFHLHLRRYEPL